LPLSLVALGAITVPAGATSLNTTNGGVLNGGNLSVAVSSTCINFYNTATPDACPNTGALDTWSVNAPSDTSLFTLGGTGTIKDLPITSASVVDFMTIGSIMFDMTSIIVPNQVACPPVGAPASCSAGDFVFTQDDFSGGTTGDVSVSFSLNAIGYTGTSTSGSTPYKFTFSSQFTNTTISTLLTQFINAPPVVDSVSFSASPVSGVPEPSAYLLLGSGLLGLGLLGKRVRVR